MCIQDGGQINPLPTEKWFLNTPHAMRHLREMIDIIDK